MSRPKLVSPFAPLQLTLEDVERLEQLAQHFVANAVAQYEEYLRVDERKVDESVWKFVKQRENVRAYVERKRPKPPSQESVNRTARASSSTILTTSQQSDMPVMLIVGSTTGTLDDSVYGMMEHSAEDARIKTSYVRNNVSDVALLATLVEPTQEDPFRSVTIKWIEIEQAWLAKPFMKKCDFVFLEISGVTRLSTGERAGYHLMHSVHFPQTHALPTHSRGNISLAGIGSQVPGSHEIDVCLRGILDPGGHAVRILVVNALVVSLMSLWKYVDCGQSKKLKWLLRRSYDNQQKEPGASNAAAHTQTQPLCCSMCTKAPSVLSRSVLKDSRKRYCSLCAQYVCSSCRIKKTLSHLDSATGALKQRAFAFCTACIHEAVHLSAFAVAQHEVASRSSLRTGLDDLFSTSSSGNS
uniref:FYVE-type domain-containing protein n=1 Tax=Globisporangium ultimum (strain ATCC 200006 / CBS 805.95 / DAOM BR144) TaxID=431595 RepID=K3W6B3_GLOUD